MTAIARLILPILRWCGRWLIRRSIKRGVPAILRRIAGRIDEFRDRFEELREKARHAKTALMRRRCGRRMKWLQFRISWRERLVRFLEKYRARLTRAALEGADRAIDRLDERLPDWAPRDSWDQWRKAA